ncbi:TRAP-type mannitol/chloroaromatic compound transport system substrate-binding protein [Xanthobacter agilis]|jgi:TRAP-type mannitol/chloroaromatic compound transport system substrate-binding protein|uniref:TRAP-type mannitol/chloroaromatic compound transport system substrate-binding protein n=1 Tax=Xanthobacter agilis TaxID=47492 RepID=A0ABU0LHB5_XANAG|nr:TRAP transporter substrate-binding protein [Xanthobacter agilis]MDQ0506488.1 TRAP-type mannitol/chloroaromatic compound transport system substrate-binding protein [Xanthobacter agilis]
MDIKRRRFMGATAAVAASTAVAAPAIAQSAPDIKWRLTSSFPRSLDTIYGTAQILAQYVAEATDGKFQIQTFPAGEIVPGLQALDATSTGSVDCAHTATYFYTGKNTALAFGTGVPFGFNSRQQQSWWQFGGGSEIINRVLADYNVTAFSAGNSGCQMGGFFRKELTSVEDLKGLKFRIGGLGGQVLAKLGVVPQQIAPGDVYPALERGSIDATEFVGPYDDEKLGLVKVAKYYYYPGWWEGGAMLHLIVNNARWAALPKHYQSIVKLACEAANTWMLAKYDYVNPPALRRLVQQGAELRPFPPAIMEAGHKAALELYKEQAAANPAFKEALDSMNAMRTDQLVWWQIAEYAFDSFNIRNRGKS